MRLKHYFNLVDVQARMALRSDASSFKLGYVWWILEPLLYVCVFYVVFGVIRDSGRIDFLPFLMCGKLTFIWFSRSVNQASNSIVSSSGLIGRLDIPKSLFPMGAVQQNLYKQVAVFVFLFAALIFWGYDVTLAWLWILPVVFVQYLLIVACALLGSVLVCYIRDFSMIINLGTVFLLFSSGIFWDVRALSDPAMSELILLVNPLAFLLDAYRQVLMYETVPDLVRLLQLAVVFSIVIALVIAYMRRASQRLAFKALTS